VSGAAAGRARRRRWDLTAVGVLLAVAFLLPYLVMVLGSLKTQAEILHIPPSYLPRSWRFGNYRHMWSTPETPLPYNLVSTLAMSAIGTAVVLAAAIPAAYYTARQRFPGRMAFLALVLITQMLQPVVLVTGLIREAFTLDIEGTWFAMIMVDGAFNLSFAVWILHSFFAAVPEEIEEAAQLDGLNRVQIMTRVSLPLIWPGIVTATIFTIVSCWNEYAASLVILADNAKNQPLSVALTKFVGQYETAWQYVFALSTVSIVPVVALFALIEKRLVAGLTAGAVK
jgi:multiple sugar transport system permease protein